MREGMWGFTIKVGGMGVESGELGVYVALRALGWSDRGKGRGAWEKGEQEGAEQMMGGTGRKGKGRGMGEDIVDESCGRIVYGWSWKTPKESKGGNWVSNRSMFYSM